VVVRTPGGAVDAAGLQAFTRGVLRGSKTPEVVMFADSLPFTETGKLLRRVVQADLVASD
jgi:acyl-CoA synthetase (AMP-forming)/AMP-acid ligase II